MGRPLASSLGAGDWRLAALQVAAMIIGIMLKYNYSWPDVPVDPQGKFCYGRDILKQQMVISRLLTTPCQSAGAPCRIHQFASLRR